MRIGFLRACAGLASCLAVVLLGSCRIDAADHSITAPEDSRTASLAGPDGVTPQHDDGAAVRVTNIRVQRVSGERTYEAVEGGLGDDARVYIDRLYTYQDVPPLVQGQTYIQTASGDQASSGNPEFLSFDIDRAAIVYVAYHGQDPPAWIADGFTDTGATVIVRKNGPTMRFHLYARTFPAGEVVLGSNRDGEGSAAMYTVILKPAPVGGGPPVGITEIEVASGGIYAAVEGGLGDGAVVYMDRDYTYEEVLPQVAAQTYIRTRSSDQAYPATSEFLRFRIDRAATVYVAYHAVSPPPAWIQTGFTNTGQHLIVRRNQQRLRYFLWAKDFPAGQVVLGSNRDGGSQAAMYTVIVAPASESEGPFSSITAGFYHSCGLSTAGLAYCWGDNTDRGQLGNGTWTSSRTPVPVAGGHVFGSVSAGAYHSCGVTTAGQGLCWGKNTYGQLGNGTKSHSNQPVPVAMQAGRPWAWIGAGGYSSCGVDIDGKAYCWGRNNLGQLGSNANFGFTTSTPVAVRGARVFALLSVGFEHVCGVTTAEAAYCWGKNTLGQLGDGTNTNRRVPVAVVDGLRFGAISVTGAGTGPTGAGQNHSCGLTTPEGRAYCWGDNWHNNLGTNLGRGHRTRPQQVVGVPTFRSIVTGGDHSCAVTAGGEAWCWGENVRGQLGSGPPLAAYNPAVRVAGGLSVEVIAGGWDHTCAITTSGYPFCWGWNNKGQIGDGSLMNRHRPVPVQLP